MHVTDVYDYISTVVNWLVESDLQVAGELTQLIILEGKPKGGIDPSLLWRINICLETADIKGLSTKCKRTV